MISRFQSKTIGYHHYATDLDPRWKTAFESIYRPDARRRDAHVPAKLRLPMWLKPR